MYSYPANYPNQLGNSKQAVYPDQISKSQLINGNQHPLRFSNQQYIQYNRSQKIKNSDRYPLTFCYLSKIITLQAALLYYAQIEINSCSHYSLINLSKIAAITTKYAIATNYILVHFNFSYN